jgi:hypothetical protein
MEEKFPVCRQAGKLQKRKFQKENKTNLETVIARSDAGTTWQSVSHSVRNFERLITTNQSYKPLQETLQPIKRLPRPSSLPAGRQARNDS